MFFKAAKVGIQDIERHLDGVKAEAMPGGNFRVLRCKCAGLSAGEPDIPYFAGLACLLQDPISPVFRKNPVRVFEAEDFMVLDQVDTINIETLE